jgi:hypothetical protein
MRKDAEKLDIGNSSSRKKAVSIVKKNKRNPDISLYKERNDHYKILSNRIKTRA